MAKRETLAQFAKNFPNFSPAIQKRILKNWQTHTLESFTTSQKRVPVLTGFLQRSGSFLKAKITSTGIKSSIIYTMPYAQRLEDGKIKKAFTITAKTSSGLRFKIGDRWIRKQSITVPAQDIDYSPVGTRIWSSGGFATKAQKGQAKYLESSIEDDEDNVIEDIKKSISQAFQLI